MRRLLLLALALAALAAGGCDGENEPEPASAPTPPAETAAPEERAAPEGTAVPEGTVAPGEPVPGQAALPLPDLTGTCEEVAAESDLAVLCPPAGAPPGPALAVLFADLDPDPCAYVMDLEPPGGTWPPRRPTHVLLGGSCAPLPLEPDDGAFAAEGPESLRLVGSAPLESGRAPRTTRPEVLREIEVRGEPGLLLQNPPYPEGGFAGGNLTLVWNEEGRGYMVSARFHSTARGDEPAPAEVAALRAVAERAEPVTG